MKESGFDTAQVRQHIERLTQAPSMSADAPGYMAAVLEVVASQMLQRAGDVAVAELDVCDFLSFYGLHRARGLWTAPVRPM